MNGVSESANRITPIQGQPFDVSISGPQKGECWTLQADGKAVATGEAAKAGTVTVSTTPKKALSDKDSPIRVSGSRTVTTRRRRPPTSSASRRSRPRGR